MPYWCLIRLSNLSNPFTPNPLPNSPETTLTILRSSLAFHATFLWSFRRYSPLLGGRSFFYVVVVVLPQLKPLSYSGTVTSTPRFPFTWCIELSAVNVSTMIINRHVRRGNNTIYKKGNIFISEHESKCVWTRVKSMSCSVSSSTGKNQNLNWGYKNRGPKNRVKKQRTQKQSTKNRRITN